ncbi:MAG: hypothetical protein PHU25_20505, partial [Deltaproteobacteria bacterium]|nr:hypothetical protein [Deltaproteobacteria bacterium]
GNSDQCKAHFCYARCAPGNPAKACAKATDACVAFDAQKTTYGCVPTGTVTGGFESKILAEGVKAKAADLTENTGLAFSLDGKTIAVDKWSAVGGLAKIPNTSQKAVVILLSGMQADTAWALELIVPEGKWKAGALSDKDFTGILTSGKVEGKTVTQAFVEGVVNLGSSMVLTKAPAPGAAQKASGSVDIKILGIRGETVVE